MTLPLSAFIITKNEETRLSRCLEALASWVGDIVLVDAGSDDRTVEIASAYGARIFRRNWTGYGPQKRFAEQQCLYDWVLNIDADEVVTPDLMTEILGMFETDNLAPEAFRIPILTVYPGRSKPRPWANDYNVVRLYHRSVGTYRSDAVHDRVDIGERRPRQLAAPIYHHTYISIAHAVRKALAFSKFRAETTHGRSTAFLKARLVLEFPLVFLKTYFWRRHFTGGWQGYYFSLCHAFMRTTRIAFMLESR